MPAPTQSTPRAVGGFNAAVTATFTTATAPNSLLIAVCQANPSYGGSVTGITAPGFTPLFQVGSGSGGAILYRENAPATTSVSVTATTNSSPTPNDTAMSVVVHEFPGFGSLWLWNAVASALGTRPVSVASAPPGSLSVSMYIPDAFQSLNALPEAGGFTRLERTLTGNGYGDSVWGNAQASITWPDAMTSGGAAAILAVFSAAGGAADESITNYPIGALWPDAPYDDGMAALLPLFNRRVTLGQVNAAPALWSPMLFMADPQPADDVDLWIDILQAIQDAPAGDATVTGQLITAVASLLAGAAQADSQVPGQTITATASLLAGAAQAGASVAGQTVSTSASILPGSVTADSSVAAQTLTTAASIVPGAAQASSQVSGQTVSATASLIPGAAASGVVVAGQTVAVTASLIAGAVTASSQANGSSLLVQASLLAGGVAADSQAAGALLAAAASLIPGSASGLASATVNGQTLSAAASLLPGAASSGSGGAGGPFFVRHAPSPRKVIRINP